MPYTDKAIITFTLKYVLLPSIFLVLLFFLAGVLIAFLYMKN